MVFVSVTNGLDAGYSRLEVRKAVNEDMVTIWEPPNANRLVMHFHLSSFLFSYTILSSILNMQN